MLSRIRARLASGDSGFTLVELLVVILLLAIVTGIASSGMISSLRTSRRADARVSAVTELQVAAERIAREVRVADGRLYPSGVEGEVLVADPDQIALEVFRDGKRVRYRFWRTAATMSDPERLWQRREVFTSPASTTVASTSQHVLIDDFANGATPVFSYLDEGAVAGATGGDITAVEIVLVKALPEQGPVRVSTRVDLRNANLFAP